MTELLYVETCKDLESCRDLGECIKKGDKEVPTSNKLQFEVRVTFSFPL
jgi:hypothetical protein